MKFTKLFFLPIITGLLVLINLSSFQHSRLRITPEGNIGMGNPAAVYCKELGYEFSNVKDKKGDRGICQFPDGIQCDGWEFVQGECGQGYSQCAQLGLDTRIKSDGKNPFSRTYAVCVDENDKRIGTATELIGLTEKSLGCSSSRTEKELQNETNEIVKSSPDWIGDPPASFDWRDNNGDWTTPIKNQGSCGSCWAFAAVGATEAAINISRGDPAYDLNLSEQYLVTDFLPWHDCCGGNTGSALSKIRDEGIPDDDCLTYVDGGGCSCGGDTCDSNCAFNDSDECSDRRINDRCSDWSSRLVDIETWGYVDNSSRVNIQQTLVTYGPLPASVIINSGSPFWDGDVYRCEDDSVSVNHGVVIVGYDDSGGYWIVRNSWGSTWGNGGYYKVGYGECKIEEYLRYVTDNQPPDAPSSPEPANGSSSIKLNTDLTWTGEDPNPGDDLTYDVYLDPGSGDPAELVCDDVAQETCDPGILAENTLYSWKVTARDPYGEESTGSIWQFTTGAAEPQPAVDFDGDGKADPAKFYPSTGTVWWLGSRTDSWETAMLGSGTFDYVPYSDYDGDGKTDPGKFSAFDGTVWYIKSSTGAWEGTFLGTDTYTYVGGNDFDGDDKTDPTKLLPNGAIWYPKSSTGTWVGFWVGPEDFKYVAGSDFDGDGETDPAKFIADPGVLWYYQSSTSSWVGVFLGSDTYTYVSKSDFDGDGKTDPAKFYADTDTVWWLKSTTGTWDAAYMGSGSFTFVGGNDFDGDEVTDPAKYDASTGTLSWLQSSTGTWDSADMGTDDYDLVN